MTIPNIRTGREFYSKVKTSLLYFIPVSNAEQFLLPSRLVFRTLRDSPMSNQNQCYGHVSHPGRPLVCRQSKVDIVLGWPVRSGLSMLGRHLRTQSGNISRYFNTHFPVFSKILWNLYLRPMS